VVNEAGAVEEDVDRPDLPRERFDRLCRAGVELARLGVEPVARPMPAAAAVSNAAFPANRPAMWGAPSILSPRPS
jgi:hypothetical protein